MARQTKRELAAVQASAIHHNVATAILDFAEHRDHDVETISLLVKVDEFRFDQRLPIAGSVVEDQANFIKREPCCLSAANKVHSTNGLSIKATLAADSGRGIDKANVVVVANSRHRESGTVGNLADRQQLIAHLTRLDGVWKTSALKLFIR